jgi:hypothetical protein
MNDTLTKQELIDAAVQVVVDRLGAGREYVEAYDVARVLRERGVISHPDQDKTGYTYEERVRKSLIGKVKRLLDEETSRPNSRLLRFSSVDNAALPRLDGSRRPLHGQAVGYTTQEVYERAEAAAAAVDAQRKADRAEMKALLERATAAGVPAPTSGGPTGVTFDVAGLRAIIERFEEASK